MTLICVPIGREAITLADVLGCWYTLSAVTVTRPGTELAGAVGAGVFNAVLAVSCDS